jgi:hypothetical protein
MRFYRNGDKTRTKINELRCTITGQQEIGNSQSETDGNCTAIACVHTARRRTTGTHTKLQKSEGSPRLTAAQSTSPRGAATRQVSHARRYQRDTAQFAAEADSIAALGRFHSGLARGGAGGNETVTIRRRNAILWHVAAKGNINGMRWPAAGGGGGRRPPRLRRRESSSSSPPVKRHFQCDFQVVRKWDFCFCFLAIAPSPSSPSSPSSPASPALKVD